MYSVEHQWDALFLKHFSRSHLTKSRPFFYDITCVLLGLKPAHLVDYLPPQPQNLKLFLEELRESCDDDTHNWDDQKLCVLLLEENVLFVNHNSLSTMRKKPVFVDVSKSLDTPEVLTNEETIHRAEKPFLSCCEMLSRTMDSIDGSIPVVRHHLHDNHQTSNGNSSVPSTTAGEEGEENLCSLFGQLLGYPAVYWFDVKEGYSLDMEELIQHSVLVKGKTTTAGNTKLLKGLPHTLFSFTIPACVFAADPDDGGGSILRGKIEAWYSGLSSQATRHGLQLEMRTQTVVMPTVAL